MRASLVAQISLLRPLSHEHLACKGTCSLVVEHILIEFLAVAVSGLMVNQGVVIHMLLLIGDDTSVEHTAGSLTAEGEVSLVAGNAVMQDDDSMVHPAIGLLLDIEVAHALVFGVCLL